MDTGRAKVELLRARILPVCPARPLGCFASGRCSQDQPHEGLNPRRPRRSCGSKKWSGYAPPGRLCGCCLTPWQTSASSGGCRSATLDELRRGGVGVGGLRRMHLSDGLLKGAPLSPRSCRELREPEGVKTTFWQRWHRPRRVARQHLREAEQRLARGFGLWEGALYEIGGRIPCRPIFPTFLISPSILVHPSDSSCAHLAGLHTDLWRAVGARGALILPWAGPYCHTSHSPGILNVADSPCFLS